MPRLTFEATQLATILILGGLPYLFWASGQGYALPLSNRSVTLSSAVPSSVASENFQMNINSASAIGSMVFQYCANSPLFNVSCTPPASFSVSSATLASQTGNTGFAIDLVDSTASKLVISRTPTAANTGPSRYLFDNIANPPTNNQTTFVRISTYGSTDGSGSYIDNGSVAFSTSTSLEVGAFVPPFLNICVGLTVASDCSQQAGDSIDFGDLSPHSAGTATSQFAASTNSDTGYGLYVLGTTMTSGNNIIPASASPSSSQPGSSSFGINLRRNSSPPIGADPSGAGTAQPTSSYNLPNLYSFSPGSQLANSPNSTDYNRMTVSYIVNVNQGQPPGVYSTTLTYLAAAQF